MGSCLQGYTSLQNCFWLIDSCFEISSYVRTTLWIQLACVTLLKTVSFGSSLLREGSGSSRDVAVEQEVHQPQHQYIQVPHYIQVPQHNQVQKYFLAPLFSRYIFDDNFSTIFCSRRQWTQLQPRSTTPLPMCPGLPASSLRRSRYWEKIPWHKWLTPLR